MKNSNFDLELMRKILISTSDIHLLMTINKKKIYYLCTCNKAGIIIEYVYNKHCRET